MWDIMFSYEFYEKPKPIAVQAAKVKADRIAECSIRVTSMAGEKLSFRLNYDVDTMVSSSNTIY